MTTIPPEAIEAAKRIVAKWDSHHDPLDDNAPVKVARALLEAARPKPEPTKPVFFGPDRFRDAIARAEKAEAELAALREAGCEVHKGQVFFDLEKPFFKNEVDHYERLEEELRDLRAKVAAAVEEMRNPPTDHDMSSLEELGRREAFDILARHGLTDGAK